MSTAMFTSVDNDQSTGSEDFVNINDLEFILPQRADGLNAAIVTLSIAQPYVTGGTSSGILYQIIVDDESFVTGGFTNGTTQDGRSPVTLVGRLWLNENEHSVQAQWCATGGATAHLGGQASISAILVQL